MNIRNKISFLLVCFTVVMAVNAQEGIQPGKVRIKLKRESVEKMVPALRSSKTTIIYDGVGLPKLDRALRQAQTTSVRRMIPYSPKYDARHKASGIDLWYEMSIDESLDVQGVVEQLDQLEDVQIAQPVYLIEPQAQQAAMPFDDTSLKIQWNYHNEGKDPNLGFPSGKAGVDIDLFKAWEITTGNPNVIVAIIDGGIDVTHPDLMANLWVNEAERNGKSSYDDDGNGYMDDIHGHDFVTGRLNIEPVNHGTHVAGIVGAVSNNGIGIAGVAGGSGNNDGVRLMSCQMLSSEGKSGGVVAAFVYAADNGAVIAQCSWVYNVARQNDPAILEAIDYFIQYAGKDESGLHPLPGTPMNGGLVVFAAGNLDIDHMFYPSSYEKCFSVAAVDIDGKKAKYSNYASWVDISAPGGTSGAQDYRQIYSTLIKGKYGPMEGTSMACPHVSGVAALLLSHYGNEQYTPEMLKYRIMTAAESLDAGNPDYAGKLGAGLLKAYASFDERIPDVEANLFFGKFPMNVEELPERPFRILNSTEGEMVLKEIRLPESRYQLSGFTPGTVLRKGEFVEMKVRITPPAYGEYKDSLFVYFGGDFEGVVSSTLLSANVLDVKTESEIVVFSDDFERGASLWGRYDGDDNGKGWILQFDNPGRYFALSGTGFIMSESGMFADGVYSSCDPDNWLVSPSIDLTDVEAGANVALSYWIWTFSPRYDGEKYKVLVSEADTDAFDPTDFSHELIFETIVSAEYNDRYNYRSLPLSAFSGKKIRIAFVHTGNPQKMWIMMDDVKVSYYPGQNRVELSIDELAEKNYEMTDGETLPVVVQLSNKGALPAEQVNVSYQLGTGKTVTETIDVIPPHTTVRYRFDEELTVRYTGETDTLHIAVTPFEDEPFTWNNRLDQPVLINKYPSAYFWNFEAGENGVAWPKEVSRITVDSNKSSPDLSYTQWGSNWAAGREAFLLVQFPVVLHPSLGVLSAASNSCYTPSGTADRWMVFSVPAIQTDSLLLKWTASSFDIWKWEDYEVQVSEAAYPKMAESAESGFDSNDFTMLQSYSEVSNRPHSNYLDLTDYAGKDFCFAFRHTTTDGVVLLLDNIRLLAKDYSGTGIRCEKVTSGRITTTLSGRLLTVESPEEMELLTVFDISGRIVSNTPVKATRYDLNLDKLKPGYYLLRVALPSGTEVVKLRV